MSTIRLPVFAAALIAGLASTFATPGQGQDLSADAVATVYDLASPDALAKSGGGPVAPEVRRATDTLRSDKLLTPTRIATPRQAGVLDTWSRTLAMGTRGPQFATEIAAIRDAAASGDLDARHAAVNALYSKAGRGQLNAEAMKAVDGQIDEALGHEAVESVRNTISKPDHTVEITDAKGAGQASVEVTQNDADGKLVRTVFSGDEKTKPTPDGKNLETSLVPTGACTMNEQQSADVRERLNGKWLGSNGSAWAISGTGGAIIAEELRPAGLKLAYSGTYKLGKIVAFHGFVSPDDMIGDLPGDVRAQLVGWSPKLGFTIRFDVCDGATQLKGTWASQHVTYSGTDHSISKVHDPYDVALLLTRGGGEGDVTDLSALFGSKRIPAVQP